jgi:hypothetical protein
MLHHAKHTHELAADTHSIVLQYTVMLYTVLYCYADMTLLLILIQLHTVCCTVMKLLLLLILLYTVL